MGRSGAVIIVLFAFGYSSPFIGGAETSSDIVSLPTNTSVSPPSDNVLDFLESVISSTRDIYAKIEDNSTERLLLKLKKIEAGVSANDFYFSASIVKELAEKILSLAKDVRSKIELMETEKNLRLFTARLVNGGNQTSLNNWLDSKASEITEAVASLTILYSDLSTNYQHHLSNIGVIKRRLSVLLTYSHKSVNLDDNDSDSTTQICRNGMFVCDNGARNLTCVKYCNGHGECGDGSDEPPDCRNLFGKNCPSFRCDDGQCTNVRFRCVNDVCRDGSQMHYCT